MTLVNQSTRKRKMDDDELIQKIERQVTKKSPVSKKKRTKRKESGPELYARLNQEELKRLGYIK